MYKDNYDTNLELRRYYDIMFRLFYKCKYKNMLYIGMRKNTSERWLHKASIDEHFKVDILEINENNYRYLKDNVQNRYPNVDIINGDIRNFKHFAKYGIVVWEDGPEHLKLEEANEVLYKIIILCNSFFIAAPNIKNSKYIYQGTVYGNINERHLSIITKEFLEQYEIGNIDTIGTSIVFWR